MMTIREYLNPLVAKITRDFGKAAGGWTATTGCDGEIKIVITLLDENAGPPYPPEAIVR